MQNQVDQSQKESLMGQIATSRSRICRKRVQGSRREMKTERTRHQGSKVKGAMKMNPSSHRLSQDLRGECLITGPRPHPKPQCTLPDSSREVRLPNCDLELADYLEHLNQKGAPRVGPPRKFASVFPYTYQVAPLAPFWKSNLDLTTQGRSRKQGLASSEKT